MEKPAASGCSWKESSLPWKKNHPTSTGGRVRNQSACLCFGAFYSWHARLLRVPSPPNNPRSLMHLLPPQQPRSNLCGAVLYLSKMKNVSHCIYSWRKIRKWALFSPCWGNEIFQNKKSLSCFFVVMKTPKRSLLRGLTQELLSLEATQLHTRERADRELHGRAGLWAVQMWLPDETWVQVQLLAMVKA